MLIGLLAKNAILIVEFAVQRRKAGKSLIESALQASRLRLRPILMTSFAFIIGMLPLVWTQGASAKGNHSIGISTVGGMLTGVLLGIFIIPVLYVIFQYLHEKMPSKKKTQSTSERISSSTFCFTLKLFNKHAKNTSNISGSSTGRNCGFV